MSEHLFWTRALKHMKKANIQKQMRLHQIIASAQQKSEEKTCTMEAIICNLGVRCLV